MQPLNFTIKEDTSDKLSEHNKELSRLLREQQTFMMEGNDYMVEKIEARIQKLTQSITPTPTKEHEDSQG